MSSTARYAATSGPVHAAAKPKRRARKITLFVAALLAVAAVAVAAVMFFTAKINGGAQVVAPVAVEWGTLGGAGQVVSSEGEIDCGTPTITDGELTLNISGAWPGSSCTYAARVFKPSGASIPTVVQGIEFTSNTEVAFTADSMSCGKAIANTAAPVHTAVTFTVSIPADATPGTSPASAEAGLVAVLADEYVAGDCPTI